MTRVLLIGLDPEAVDLSEPNLPEGITAELIAAEIASSLEDMQALGWDGAFCPVLADPESAVKKVVTRLEEFWDCIVIGSGIRALPSQLLLFEGILNTTRSQAPFTPIAFNTSPADTARAAMRHL